MKKTIIGIIGKKDIKLQALCDKLLHNKFKKVAIADKVREVAKYLIQDDFDDSTLESIRDRGYKVNNLYWVNLLLSSMKDADSNILIEDLSELDIVDGIMMVYYSDSQNSIQGCTNVTAWDEERLAKEISRIIRMARQ
jgi:hypothetical protein